MLSAVLRADVAEQLGSRLRGLALLPEQEKKKATEAGARQLTVV